MTEQPTLPRLSGAVDKALPMIKEVEETHLNRLNQVNTEFEQIVERVTGLQGKVKELVDKRDLLRTGGVSRAGRKRKNTEHVIDVNKLEEYSLEIGNVKSELSALKKNEKGIKELVTEVEKKYDDWKQEFPYRTYESLAKWGRQLLIPAKEYYSKLFNDSEGDCSNVTNMAEAAELFNPIMLSEITDTEIVTKLHYLADKLMMYQYESHFTEGFIRRLKKEIPDVVKEAKRDHDLERIQGNKQYHTRLQKRMKRYKILNEDDMDWKNDAGEYARRIWEWWRTRVDEFPCHAFAIRLVVLSQLSSCSVERVFSRLSLIRERCSDSSFEDMTEIRLFMQCNGNLEDLYESALKFNSSN